MKGLLILIVAGLFACNNEAGFTNKVEARNEIVSGLKEGKWIEYIDSVGKTTSDTNKAAYYSLSFYKSGTALGIVRHYNKKGDLLTETPYTKGKENGLEKWFYLSGKLRAEIPYTDGRENGVAKYYYESGQLSGERVFSDGKINETKYYDEHGNPVSHPINEL